MTAPQIDRPAIEKVLSTARVSDAEREALIADPGFGRIHTDHMVAIRWNVEQGWHDAKLTAYEPLQLDPSNGIPRRSQRPAGEWCREHGVTPPPGSFESSNAGLAPGA